MKLIFAQGNPGQEYEKTRHNIGFVLLDAFARHHKADFQTKSKFFSDIAEFSHGDEKVLLIKPTTFYNETGRAAQTILDFYKIDSHDLLVIHDDIALPFGTLRTREKGSDAGNNGIKSLNAHIGQEYARLRVGVWNELGDRMDTAAFVLAKFSADEHEAITSQIIPQSAELLTQFIEGNFIVTSLKNT